MRHHTGVAIITHRRPSHLRECLDAVLHHSAGNFSLIVSSDEAENDEVDGICDERGVPVLKGPNKGVVWNKNRALHCYMAQTNCDVIILLEDDAKPYSGDWLQLWSEAGRKWHHVNWSAPGTVTPERTLRGVGTPSDPHLCTALTGQCTAISRSAMNTAGYLDPRFSGYGHGHVEWTVRHHRLMNPDLPQPPPDTFISIAGSISLSPSVTSKSDEQLRANSTLFQSIRRSEAPGYRSPWRDDDERREMAEQIYNAPLPALHDGGDKAAEALPADFDGDLYLALHADVKAARLDPAYHYLTYGRREGRRYRLG